MRPEELARYIDHTLLRGDATEASVLRLCDEALEWGFRAVCVHPCRVQLAARRLAGSSVRVCTVVGFPLGGNTTYIKVLEARRALEEGAREIDVVANLGAIKDGRWKAAEEDIAAVVGVARGIPGTVVKVIIETGYLTDDEKVRAARMVCHAGADFVKTSTGFGPGGATVEDVALLRRAVGRVVGVKAAGGIRTREQALAMIRAGANRIGTSAGVAVVSEAG